jgi:CRP/FNR family cyclic AMP-dependent transcriptional regulator
VDVLVSRLRETNQTIAAMSFLSIKARVARTLLELAKHLGESESTGHVLIRHKLNQGDIAAMAGVVGRHCWQSLERTSSARKFSTIMRNGHANQSARLSSFAARLAPELVRSSDC